MACSVTLKSHILCLICSAHQIANTKFKKIVGTVVHYMQEIKQTTGEQRAHSLKSIVGDDCSQVLPPGALESPYSNLTRLESIINGPRDTHNQIRTVDPIAPRYMSRRHAQIRR